MHSHSARRNATLCFIQALWYYWNDTTPDRAEHCIMHALTWTYPIGDVLAQSVN